MGIKANPFAQHSGTNSPGTPRFGVIVRVPHCPVLDEMSHSLVPTGTEELVGVVRKGRPSSFRRDLAPGTLGKSFHHRSTVLRT
jgi:hypothetical protein